MWKQPALTSSHCPLKQLSCWAMGLLPCHITGFEETKVDANGKYMFFLFPSSQTETETVVSSSIARSAPCTEAWVTDIMMFAMPWCLSHWDWQSFGFTFFVFFLHLIKKVLHFNWKHCNLMLETYGLSNSLPHLIFKMCSPPLFPSCSLKSSCELHPRCNKREMNLTAVLNDIR